MTDSNRGTRGSMGPPWSVDVLADLHAGALDPELSSQLWPQVNADPEARLILDALESTTSELHSLATLPAPPMPEQYAAKLDAAIAAELRSMSGGGGPREQTGGATVVDFAAARQRRNRRLGIGVGVFAAAAAVAAIAVAVLPGNTTGGGGVAAPATSSQAPPGGSGTEPPLAVRSDDMGSAFKLTTDKKNYGPLKDDEGLTACREANQVPSSIDTVGFQPVTLDGKPAMLLLLTTGEPAQFRLLFVEPTCGPGNPGLIKDTKFGGVPN